MKTIVLSLFLLLAQPVFAALPPLYQSVAEWRELVDSEELTDSFPTSQMITSITAVEKGYIVLTQEYKMLVEVKYLSQSMPGPAQFKLLFHEPTKHQ